MEFSGELWAQHTPRHGVLRGVVITTHSPAWSSPGSCEHYTLPGMEFSGELWAQQTPRHGVLRGVVSTTHSLAWSSPVSCDHTHSPAWSCPGSCEHYTLHMHLSHFFKSMLRGACSIIRSIYLKMFKMLFRRSSNFKLLPIHLWGQS